MRALGLAILVLLPSIVADASSSAAPVGDLIVTWRDAATSGAGTVVPAPARAIPLALFDGFVLLDATAGDIARLRADPRVERVDLARPLAFAADARLPTRAFTQLTRADATGLDGSGIGVAVVDSGIDSTHPDLVGRVRENVRLAGGRFLPTFGDPDGHGTHVAGIVAASGDPSRGRWSGVAPGAHLVGVDISSRFTTASAILAYDWLLAEHDALGVRVVVNAWGRVDEGERYDARDPVMRAIDRLVDDGVVVVFSASNHGPAAGTLSMEAMHPRVVSVGATDAAGMLVDYSSRGPVASESRWIKPDVVAPGDAVVGPRSAQSLPRESDPDALHTVYSGTSQAAPHVAGIVAMMLQADPRLTPDEVGRSLRASAIDLAEPGPDDATGWGLVDAEDALRVARGLAPGRDNILVTGGVDRYHDGAELAPTPARGIFELLARPDLVWETSFPVKPGARNLRVDARADGADDVAIELAHDGRVFEGASVDDPAPGVWTLRLRATLPIATAAIAIVETDLPPDQTRALNYDGRQPERAPPVEAASEMELLMPLGALTVAALAAIVLVAALLARRK